MKYYLFLLLLFLSDDHTIYGQDAFALNIVLTIPAGLDNPRNSEGDFVTLKDGRLLFVYTHYEGTSGSDHAPAQLMGRYSSDQGKTWSSSDELIIDNDAAMNVMSVSMLRLQDGRLAIFYLRKNSLEDCIPQMRISSDEGETWSAPTPCITDHKGYFVVNNDRIIQLENGRIVVPTSLHQVPGSEWSHKGELRCYYSDDVGLTWHSGEVVPTPDSIITQEPGLVELNDGRIMMIIRASGGLQYQAFSIDQGLSWSYAEPTQIASPISPASLERITSTGDLLLVWNNNGESGPGYFKAKRTPLTVAISTDVGETWNYQKNIEDNPEGFYCYTAIHAVEDYVLLAYGKKEAEGELGICVRRLGLLDIYEIRDR